MSTLETTPSVAARSAPPLRRVARWVEVAAVLGAPAVVVPATAVGADGLGRYVLALVATVPAYVWLRGRSVVAGAAVVAILLTASPVAGALAAGGAGGIAVAGLLGGLPLLARWTTGVRRLLVRGPAGLLLGAAVCAQPCAVPVVLGALLVFVAGAWSRHTGLRRARTRRVTVDLLAVTGGLATAVLGALLHGWHGWEAGFAVAGPGPAPSVATLLVPPVVVIGWVWLWCRRRRSSGERPPRGDEVIALGGGVGYLAALATTGPSSLVWAGVCLTTALLVADLSSSWWPGVVAAADRRHGDCRDVARRAMLRVVFPSVSCWWSSPSRRP